MKKLHLSEDLALPLDASGGGAVTQAIGILAKRRAGKSFTARRLVEQLVKAKQQVVIVDPKGDWWGIRSAANGKDAGLPVVILGGEHGDVKQLEPGSGEVIAKLVVEERVSVLIDVSGMRKGEVAHFMGGPMPPRAGQEGFLEALYRLKNREQYREPLMLVIDEADAIAPQKPQRGEERMLGAAEDIVRRGGQRGIGCTLITQRSAVLNKNVLTQCQMLIALRTIAPQDLAALNAWVDVHGTPEERETLMASLPSLPVGDAWVWSPGWPTNDGIFQRVHVLPIETFDSGATPRPGEKRREPKTLAAVDLDALQRQMAETIEKAKAEDPRELRKTISELRAELKRKDAVLAEVDVRTKRIDEKLARVKPARVIEKAVLKDAQIKRLEAAIDNLDARQAVFQGGARKLLEHVLERGKTVDAHLHEIKAALAAARNREREGAAVGGSRPGVPAAAPHSHAGRGVAALIPDPPAVEKRLAVQRAPRVNDDGAALPKAQQRIVDSLAWLHGVGIATPDKTQVSLFADLVPGAGHTVSMFGALRSAGLIDYPTPGTATLTDAGRGRADTSTVPQSAEEMQQQVLAKLPKAQREILRVLIPAYPTPMAKEDVAAKAGLVAGAGHTVSMFGRLRSLGLIDYPTPGQVLAEKVLFLEA